MDHCVSSPRWSLTFDVGEDRSVCSTDWEFVFQGRLTKSDNQFAGGSDRLSDCAPWKYTQRMIVFEGITFAELSVWVPASHCLTSQILMYPRLRLALNQCAASNPYAPAFNENKQPHLCLCLFRTFYALRASHRYQPLSGSAIISISASRVLLSIYTVCHAAQ